MGVLGTHAPAASLPQRTQVLRVVGSRLVALEAVWEDWLLWAATKSLPQHCACVSIFALTVWWPLTSEDTGDVDAGGREYSRW